MNLLCNFIQLQMFRCRVEQDEIRLEMERRMEGAPIMALLPDQVLACRQEGRSHDRGEVRGVINEKDALGTVHQPRLTRYLYEHSVCQYKAGPPYPQVRLF